MSNQTQDVTKIADTIKVLQGGIDFYQKAIGEVDSSNVQHMFRRMIKGKEEAIESLQPFAIKEQGERETDSDWMVSTRKIYTQLIGKMSSDEDHTYIKQLEEVEDRVLEVLDEALKHDQPESCLIALRTIRAKAQQMHDEMKALQEATA
ncbi:PA2169 family four-helix-bundle protein [Glaciecola siphonariae]|uniref:PA2169 family four-helix-bundle protein n=1 Tax=Glaciecola siphonariae TaxID=521012 RepID=A0ABV9LVU9_9ALTE